MARIQTGLQVNKGLVGYWPLGNSDTVRGNVALDLSNGQRKKGTLVGSPSVIPGRFGRALNLNGTTQGVTLVTSLFSSNLLTICLWAQFQVLNAYQGVFSIFTGDGDCCEIFVDAANRLFGGGFNSPAHTDTGIFTIGTWVHVGLTTVPLQFYINGVANGTTGTVAFSTFTPIALVGARTSIGNLPLTGAVAELRAYNRVLSPGEINYIYSDRSGHLGLIRPPHRVLNTRSRGLFSPSPLSGLGSGGSLFSDRLAG